MRAWFTILLLAALALSGCADGGTTEGTDSMDPDPTGTMDSTNSTAEADASETAEDAGDSTSNATTEYVAPALNASLDMSEVEVGAPVNVTIDAVGSNLTWQVSLDGTELANGTEVPATYQHTFDAVGSYTFVVVVADGRLNDTAELAVSVIEADPCDGAERCKIGEDLWAEFWSDGICEAKGEALDPSGYYVHDRAGKDANFIGVGPSVENPTGGTWTGTGYLTGGGTWFYEESNGLPGLQLGGHSSPVPILGSGEVAAYADCANPDTLIF